MIYKLMTILAICFLPSSLIQCKANEEVATESTAATSDETEDEEGDTGAATGALAISIEPSFPTGVAVTGLTEATESEDPVDPVVGGLAVEASTTLMLDDKKNADPCADVDLDEAQGETAQQGVQNDINNDNSYIQCRQSMTYGEKFAEQRELITGEAEKCFRRRWIQAVTMQQANTCYNFAMANDTGLTEPSNKLCTVAWTQDEMAKVAMVIETGLLMTGSALCQARQNEDELTLPEAGADPLDIKTLLSTAFESAGETATVSSATVQRLSDEGNRQVYKTAIALTGIADTTRKYDDYRLTVINAAAEDDSAAFFGSMWISYKRSNTGEYTMMNLRYSHTGDSVDDLRLTYELRHINNIKLASDGDLNAVITNEGVLDYNRIFSPSETSTYASGFATTVSGIRYVAMDLNPWSQVGSIAAYQNPGVNYTEDAVGMVFVNELSGSTLKGCAAAGALKSPSLSIRKYLADGGSLIPSGRRCAIGNSIGMCSTNQDDGKVWYQCFKQEEAGDFTLDTTKISDTTKGFDIPTASSLTIKTEPDTSRIPTFSQNVLNP